MKVSQRLLVLFIVICASITVVAQSPHDLWQNAQEAYLKGDTDTAAPLFEEYLSQFPFSYAGMYNLGNCYLQEGSPGKAILWYERARKLRPHDKDVLHNLAIARAKMENPVVEIREFFVVRWIRTVSGYLSVGMWGLVSLVLFWLVVGLYAMSIRQGGWDNQKKWAAISLAVCFAISLILGLQRYQELRRHDMAIVLIDEVPVSIAPDPISKLVLKISAGEKVVIIDSLDNYYKVRLANFEQGWIPVVSVERI
jgi:hypothetical protein